MTYTSYEDLADTIRKNLWKIPEDIDIIVGVPRSGMIAAYMVAEFLNKRVTDLDSFIEGNPISCGGRGDFLRHGAVGRVLVLDDTVFNGTSMQNVRDRLANIAQAYDITYACVYAEGRDAKSKVDIWMEDNYNPNEFYCHLYEWNILHHGDEMSGHCLYDLDGVLCKEPPDERDTKAYEEYISNAIPMAIPSTKIGGIVTYRLEKYRKQTEEWLKKAGVDYGCLIMFDAPTYEQRAQMESPSSYKARIYKTTPWAWLFVESDINQAEHISRLSGKPTFCYENGRML